MDFYFYLNLQVQLCKNTINYFFYFSPISDAIMQYLNKNPNLKKVQFTISNKEKGLVRYSGLF